MQLKLPGPGSSVQIAFGSQGSLSQSSSSGAIGMKGGGRLADEHSLASTILFEASFFTFLRPCRLVSHARSP